MKRLTQGDRIAFAKSRIKDLKKINTPNTRERAHGIEEAIRIFEGYNDDEVKYQKKRVRNGKPGGAE